MCIEVYSKEQPVQILFEHETFRFLGPRSFRGRYILLVRNAGYAPISLLSILFPRPLIQLKRVKHADKKIWSIEMDGVVDATNRLPDIGPFFGRPQGERLSATLPDPNNPTCDLPGLEGYWKSDNVTWSLPQGLTYRCLMLMEEHHFSAWNAELTQPIEPGDAHWFCWEMTAKNEGDVLDNSIFGPVVFHEITSPIDVRRTLVEAINSALRDIHECGPDAPGSEHETSYRRLLWEFGLHLERRVDIQYYELNIETGDPKELFVAQCLTQGDIRLRSGSPRVGRHLEWDKEFLHEPVYEWKSGSILEPTHPWRNTGFSIRLALAFKKSRKGRPSRRRKN